MTGGSSPLARGLRIQFGPFMLERGIIPARAGFTPAHAGRSPGAQDHPRSRGVYHVPVHHRRSDDGSSPLARGLQPERPQGRPKRGIIPARAGFTPRNARRSARPRDHPRSRGVYWKVSSPGAPSPGSSPLARGLRVFDRHGHSAPRIIPARAGFTPPGRSRDSRRRDHPRSRGVYRAPSGFRENSVGSSPLARGLRTSVGSGTPKTGIIPARAGFTWGWDCFGPAPGDHPRSRGVYTPEQVAAEWHCGSSPLARGLLPFGVLGLDHAGIIPARAGFTVTHTIFRLPETDHPRSRGVYTFPSERARLESGSSPLARGLPARAAALLLAQRIIPARAGFTRRRPRPRGRRGDHPRSRGVYLLALYMDDWRSGSSPLARGLLDAALEDVLDRRIIPARAGFTGRKRRPKL